MATKSVRKTPGWLLVAEGPQDVSFGFPEGVGECQVSDTAASSAFGLYVGKTGRDWTLSAGERLYVDGVGVLVVVAQTLHPDFVALPDAERG